MNTTRFDNEERHGHFLAEHGAEDVWGWGSPAGRIRAGRRACLLAKGARLATGVRALEVGCGTGLFTEHFIQQGARVLAVDLSDVLLEIARKRGLPADRVQFITKPFEECEVDGPFDAVIGSSVLHHLDMTRALPKLFQLLRPGGWLCFAEPNMLNPQILMQKNIPWLKARLGDSPDETAFVRWQLAADMRACGFSEIAIRPYDWLHPLTPKPLIGAVSVLGRVLEYVPLVREMAGSLIIQGRRPELASHA